MTTTHVERLRLQYRPDDLFALVSDIRLYPEFIKQISAIHITGETRRGASRILEAEARVKYKFVRERFTTRVSLDPDARLIDVTYLSGPFNDLANHWRFTELSDGSTLVDFWIRYSLRNRMLQMLVDANRTRAVTYLIRAFEIEAGRRFESIGRAHYDLRAEPAMTAPPNGPG